MIIRAKGLCSTCYTKDAVEVLKSNPSKYAEYLSMRNARAKMAYARLVARLKVDPDLMIKHRYSKKAYYEKNRKSILIRSAKWARDNKEYLKEYCKKRNGFWSKQLLERHV